MKKVENFTSIALKELGMRGSQIYEILPKDTEAEISLYDIIIVDRKDQKRLAKLATCDKQIIIDIINDFGILSWDGFHGKHPKGVLDGIMFDFNAVIDDKTIQADGSENFPKNYKEFRHKIQEILWGK